MAQEKYVAYVSTYTIGDSHGIKIYDVDMEKGRFVEKDKVHISNSSYMTISHNKKYLYSITDFGIESYKIEADGGLDMINHAPINGMRGCYISTDFTDRYVFVAGYHDGKLTVLRLNDDGSIGEIVDEIFHKSLGIRPHVNCAKMTHDNKYLLVADQGTDHVNVYSLNPDNGKLKLVDIIRSELDSAPKHIKISEDGRFVYVLHEMKCYIDVYRYEDGERMPTFEKVQSVNISELGKKYNNTVCAFSFSQDYNYLLSSILGNNSVVIYDVNKADGTIKKNLLLPISGEYPKDAEIFPGNKFLVSLNHDSNNMTFFKVDFEKHTLIMNGPAVKVNEPNCILFHRI